MNDPGSRPELERLIPKLSDSRSKGIGVALEVEGVVYTLLVDTGADVSVIRRPIGSGRVTEAPFTPRGVTGSELSVEGIQEVVGTVMGAPIKHQFIVADILTAHDGILGMDLLRPLGAKIDVSSGRVECTRGVDAAPEPGGVSEDMGCIRVVRNVMVPPWSEVVLKGKVVWTRKEGRLEGGDSIILEPRELSLAGVRVARSVNRVGDGTTPVKLVNATREFVELSKGTPLASMHSIAPQEIVRGLSVGTGEGVVGLREAVTTKLAHLVPDERMKMQEMLFSFEDLLYGSGGKLGCTTRVRHTIPTGGATPIYRRPYPVPHHLKEEMREQIRNLLDEGVIRPSSSPWSAPVVLVPKKDRGQGVKYRFCTDFRALNAETKADVYPLPKIADTLESLGNSKWFTTIDLASGYHQIPVAEEDREKTAFSTPEGHYEYNRMPFGLSGAPATFQRAMDQILTGLKGAECFVYLDDVIIFSDTFEEHLQRLNRVLGRFREVHLKINLAKCEFAMPEVEYLGHVVSGAGVSPDPKTVKAVKEYPTPRTVKEVRAFLGLAGWYRRFMPHFAEVARPLHDLTGKYARFEWTDCHQQAFQALKALLTSDAVLAYPDFALPFVLATDASDRALGAVLSQVQGGVERPICFASRSLIPAEKNYTATEKELLAVVWATKQFRCYLYGRRFKVETDHAALRWMLSLRDPSARLTRWALRLAEFEYEVIHRPGKLHRHADALSRVVHRVGAEEIMSWDRQGILREQENDDWCNKMIRERGSKLERDEDGVWYSREGTGALENRKLLVPRSLVRRLLEHYHSSPLGGHRGVESTLLRLKSGFCWRGMERDVEEYVRGCHPCAQRKSPAGLKVPIGDAYTPSRPMEMVSLDIVGPLPLSVTNNRYLLTFIDHFTRYAEAIPIPDQTAERVAKEFVEKVVCRHGAPSKLLTDQGRNFTSSLLARTCNLLGISKIQTTAYHPESNGRLERFHRTLIDQLASYVRRDGRDWDEWVPYALAAYRSTPHSATGYSPNFMMFGREMQMPFDCGLSPQDSHLRDDEYTLGLREKLDVVAGAAKARDEVKRGAMNALRSRGRKDRTFAEGDWVYLYTPAISSGESKKFRKPWKGPYLVVERNSEITYTLQVRGERILVHVNRLKLSAREGTGSSPSRLREEKGYVFDHHPSGAIGHWVSADLDMSTGGATVFRTRFGGVEELRVQEPEVGKCLLLRRGGRAVFYLVIKTRSCDKPTYDGLRRAVEDMLRVMEAENIPSAGLPRPDCGRDGLSWVKVKRILREVTRDRQVEVVVYDGTDGLLAAPTVGQEKEKDVQLETGGSVPLSGGFAAYYAPVTDESRSEREDRLDGSHEVTPESSPELVCDPTWIPTGRERVTTRSPYRLRERVLGGDGIGARDGEGTRERSPPEAVVEDRASGEWDGEELGQNEESDSSDGEELGQSEESESSDGEDLGQSGESECSDVAGETIMGSANTASGGGGSRERDPPGTEEEDGASGELDGGELGAQSAEETGGQGAVSEGGSGGGGGSGGPSRNPVRPYVVPQRRGQGERRGPGRPPKPTFWNFNR